MAVGAPSLGSVRREGAFIEQVVQRAFDGAVGALSRRRGAMDERHPHAAAFGSEAYGAQAQANGLVDRGAMEVKRDGGAVVIQVGRRHRG